MECPACSAVVRAADVVGGVGRCQWCDHIWETGDAPSAPEIAVACPKCASTGGRIVAKQGLGRCLGCDHLWRLDAAVEASEPPSPPFEPEGSPIGVERPDGVEVIQDKNGLRIRIPWQAQLTPKVHAFFWVIGLLLMMSILSGEWTGLVVVPPFLVVYLYLLVNVTEVRLRPDGVETHHGPLASPMDPDVSLSAAQLVTLRVRSEVMKYRISSPTSYTQGREQITAHYSLYAGSTRLLRKFADRSLVTYVAQVIQETVGTPVHIVQEDDPTPRTASDWARR